MHLTSIKIENFRNYQRLSLPFRDQTVILVGANAAGKTNLLEAIRFLSLFKSWRSSHSQDLIRWQVSLARVEGEVSDSGQKHKIVAALTKEGGPLPVKRQVILNGAKVPTRAAVGKFLTVLFSPDDLLLVSSAPKERRRYLDVVLGQVSPRYFESLQRYQQALEQRNSLFFSATREHPATRREAEIWEDQMSAEGSRLIKERSSFIEELNHRLASDYQAISGDDSKLVIAYQPAISPPGVEALVEGNQIQLLLQKNWRQNWERDLAMQQTSFGPHRDDLIFLLDGRPLELCGSRGEWRSAVLALKLGEKSFIEQRSKRTPVLLLDDVFSELDRARRATLSQRLQGAQCFITTTDLAQIEGKITTAVDILRVEKGRVRSEHE